LFFIIKLIIEKNFFSEKFWYVGGGVAKNFLKEIAWLDVSFFFIIFLLMIYFGYFFEIIFTKFFLK
jgi:hypothetical protein